MGRLNSGLYSFGKCREAAALDVQLLLLGDANAAGQATARPREGDYPAQSTHTVGNDRIS